MDPLNERYTADPSLPLQGPGCGPVTAKQFHYFKLSGAFPRTLVRLKRLKGGAEKLDLGG